MHCKDKSSGPPTDYTYRNCSAVEAHAMKLPVHSFHADDNSYDL